jgi:hypothetical protein
MCNGTGYAISLRLCPVECSTTTPTRGELRGQHFRALGTGPRNASGCGSGFFQGAQGGRFEVILHPELRPSFEHGQITHRARKILVAQLRFDPSRDEQVARMRDLNQRCGAKYSFHISANAATLRRRPHPRLFPKSRRAQSPPQRRQHAPRSAPLGRGSECRSPRTPGPARQVSPDPCS